MKLRLKYFWKLYYREILFALTEMSILILPFCFGLSKTILTVCIFLCVLSFLWLIRIGSRPGGVVWIPLTRAADMQAWRGSGTFQLIEAEKAYLITSSSEGFLCSRTLGWADYAFSFDFKIVSSCLGVLVRAQNPSNLVMLQINPTGVQPHLRYKDQWRVYDRNDPSVNLSFKSPLESDRYYQATITCQKNIAKMVFKDGNKVVFDRSWVIPDQAISGAIGFRNVKDEGSNEKAYVRNVWVEEI